MCDAVAKFGCFGVQGVDGEGFESLSEARRVDGLAWVCHDVESLIVSLASEVCVELTGSILSVVGT